MPRLHQILGGLQARRLTIGIEQLFLGRTIDLQHPAFASVTHLDLLDDADTTQEISVQLSLLLALTHLRLVGGIAPRVLVVTLSDCRSLRVLINRWHGTDRAEAKIMADNPPAADPRFVVLLWSDYLADWELGARGGDDFWVQAEEFIAKKRRGEIEGKLSSLKDIHQHLPECRSIVFSP
jgi:hypothetical protein